VIDMIVVGVDGCPGGWIAVELRPDIPEIKPVFFASFEPLLMAYPETFIGVDIPIGLSSTHEPRQCDMLTRRALGTRRSSVFPAPHPGILHEPTYAAACARSRELIGKGIPKQVFHILTKIAEVNALLTPELQEHVFEVHPEASFMALAGHPMFHPKRRSAGYDERRVHLERDLRIALPIRREAHAYARPAGPDDFLDATVAAWTALRVALGKAQRVPAEPAYDRRGLRMEIVS
jgi:predicted RNase H-like nuclease